MLLITDYHKHGSLYDFLKYNTIDDDRMVRAGANPTTYELTTTTPAL
jgi:hypothetical protein